MPYHRPAVFALEAATSVRKSTLLDPIMQASFVSTRRAGRSLSEAKAQADRRRSLRAKAGRGARFAIRNYDHHQERQRKAGVVVAPN